MITVLTPGTRTTLQDGGRIGLAHLGVPHSGAADLLSLRLANRLAGNHDDQTTALEFTFTGPTLRFETGSLFALAGGEIPAQLDGVPVPMYQTVRVSTGQVLACGEIRTGFRSYLAVKGGIHVSRVLGSAGTDTLSGIGPPTVCKKDVLQTESNCETGGFYFRNAPRLGNSVCLRVLPGPHQDRFTPETIRDFYSHRFTVSQTGDRIGVRLNDALPMLQLPAELPTQGMLTGAIQIPGDGRPILLLPNHGTTGGYPVIATVIAADHGRLGQLAPGMQASFEHVTPAQALALLHTQEQLLKTDIIAAGDDLLAMRALLYLARTNPALRELSAHQGSRRIHLRR